MLTTLVQKLTHPFSTYFGLTLGEPYKSLSHHYRHQLKLGREKSHFSLIGYLRKQNAFVSPESNISEINPVSLRDEYVANSYEKGFSDVEM